MSLSSNSLQKFTSLITLVTFVSSLFAPLQYVAFAGTPDATVTYSGNPAGTGSLTISIETTEALAPGATISIDQPGSVDIVDAPLTDLGAGTGFTYVYTVMADDGSNYIDGTATVTLSGVSVSTGDPINLISGGSFTITTLPPPDTIPPVVTLSGGNMSLSVGGNYIEPGASWTDNVDGSGDTFIGTYGSTGSFAISGSVNTGSVGTYYLDYMKVDAAGNSSGATRRVDVVSAANLKNATIAAPSNDKLTNAVNQEMGRFALSAGMDIIRLESIDVSNTGTSVLSDIAGSATGVELWNAGTNTFITGGSISGNTISFSGISSIIPSYTTVNFKVILTTVGTLDPYYGQTIVLTTNSGSMSVVKDSDSSPLAVDESMFSGAMKTYKISIVPPVINLTAYNPLTQNSRVGTIRVTNVDTSTGLTVSGVTLQVSMTGGFSFTGELCLRDIGSTSACGGVGTTTGQTITENGGIFIFDTINSTLANSSSIITANGGYQEYEVYIDNAPLWVIGDAVQVSLTSLEYIAGGYAQSQSYVGVGSASMTATKGAPPDTTPPIVSLSGSSTVNIEYGNNYAELGASWTDNVDGSGSAFTGTYGAVGSFTLSGTVNTGALGTYMIEYKKVDVAGNSSGAMRTVVVQDTTAPVVTLSGADPDSIVIGNTYIDLGATWTDIRDGSGTIAVATSGSVNTGALGTYTLEYSYTDGAGNTGSVSRTVNVIAAPDTTPPTVTLSGSSTVNVEYGTDYTEYGATWTDNVDGSGDTFGGVYGATGSFAISGSVNTGALGTYYLDYMKVDAAGNSSGAMRTVVVQDTTPPTASVTYSTLSTTSGSVTATLTGANEAITITNNGGSPNYVFSSNGSFTFTFADLSGNTGSVVANVANIDTTAPVVTLSGSASVNIEYGTSYTENGANWTDNVDGSGFLATATSGSVNTGALGTYTLEYRYTDGAGNSGSVSRTVNAVDTTAPIVTLVGSGNFTLYQNSLYVESGATWTDIHDGSGTLSGPYSGSVNTGSLGTYTLDYRYVDSAGNTGSVSRTVNVIAPPDTTPPVITLGGSPTVNVEYGTSYIEYGATWTDNVDGSGSIPAYNSGSINTGALGSYVVSYEHTDSSSNVGIGAVRTVNVVDTTAPLVTLSGASPDSVIIGNTYIDLGATWTDLPNSNTGTISMATSGSVNTGALGTYTLEYEYADAGGNTGSVSRTVNVIAAPDTTPPVITLIGSGSMVVAHGSVYVDSGATALDNIDGDITASIMTGGTVDTGHTGTYILTYDVTDIAGNPATQVTRSVTVVDMTAPSVTPAGGNFITINQGTSYTESGANWTDNVDGSGFLPTPYTGSVDTNTPGVYILQYRYTDGGGNVGMGFRTVTVNDTITPTVTLSGSSTVNIEYGNNYVELGASWTDNVDGSGSAFTGTYGAVGSFALSGTVNTGALGTYMIEYKKVDVAGNSSGAMRTVVVQDTTAPMVTLSGSAIVSIVVGSGYTDAGANWTDLYDGAGSIPSYNSGFLDANNTGSYTIIYQYTDISGNTGSVSRTVNVLAAPDMTPPVVTLVGSGVIDIEYGTSYTENGANWTDNVDGSGFLATATSGSVNTGALGTYTLEYSYTDGAGNSGSVSRTVNVVDTTAPVVTLSGPATINIEYGNSYTELGASWTDLYDGAGSIPSATSGSVNNGALGTYTLEYTYTDISGNTGTTTRTVTIVDTTAPVVTLSGSSTVNVEYGADYTENGASWTDIYDGSGALPGPYSGSVNTGSLGTYTLDYRYVDSAGNTGSVSRTVNVVDTTAPVVTLVGSGVVAILSGTIFSDSGAIWVDLHDGAGSIPSYNSGTLDVNTVGTYTIEYTYTDISGNTGATARVVQVLPVPDTIPPVITLSGSSTVNVEYGNDFVDDGASWTDNVDGSGFIPAYNSGTVNTGALGSYSISYEYTDSSSNVGIGATRTVVVEDTTAPVVTPIGGATVSLVAGSIYTESGATWTDLYDGAGSVGAYSGSVDTNTVGTYMIEYRYTDTSSNVGIAFRTVNILAAPDTTPPVITLSGSSTVYVEYGSGFIDDGATWTDNVDGAGFIPAYNSGSVNTMALGTYTLEYSYTDGAGNSGSVSRTVNVVDTTAPVVTLSGVNPDNVVINNVYSDPGASWTDAVDGIGSILATSGSVNTGALGTYILEYRYTDGAGNSGSVSRTVNVIAAPAPVISMSGSFTGTGPVNVTGTSSVNSGTVIDLNGFPINLTTTSGSLSISGSTDIVVQGSGSWDGVISNPVQSLVNILELTDGGVGSSLPANTPSIIYNHRVVLTIQAGATDGSSLVASGGLFTLRYMINDPGITVGTTLNILRSQDASTWVQSSPAPTCTLDGARFCTFTTNHLSYFGFVSSTATPVLSSQSSGAGGGGGSVIGEVPLVSQSTNQGTASVNNNPNMQLGIVALQRVLQNTHTQETSVQTNREHIIVSDITDSAHEQAIKSMIEMGYMKNTKKFDPKRPMTRNEFIKVLSLAYGFVEVEDGNMYVKFGDVKNGSEFEKYIAFGIVMGWINPDMPKFRGDDAITVGEALKLVATAKGKSKATAPVVNKEVLTRENGANLIFEEIVIL